MSCNRMTAADLHTPERQQRHDRNQRQQHEACGSCCVAPPQEWAGCSWRTIDRRRSPMRVHLLLCGVVRAPSS
jgi:hypothetical protein